MRNLAIILIIWTLCAGSAAFGQTNLTGCASKYDTLSNREIYIIIDSMPEFPGGLDSLNNFIAKNLKYPIQGGCFEGAVYVSFIVEPDGRLTNKTIIKGISNPVDNEAMSLLDKMPNWIPGNCNGHVVPVEIAIPIRFNLN